MAVPTGPPAQNAIGSSQCVLIASSSSLFSPLRILWAFFFWLVWAKMANFVVAFLESCDACQDIFSRFYLKKNQLCVCLWSLEWGTIHYNMRLKRAIEKIFQLQLIWMQKTPLIDLICRATHLGCSPGAFTVNVSSKDFCLCSSTMPQFEQLNLPCTTRGHCLACSLAIFVIGKCRHCHDQNWDGDIRVGSTCETASVDSVNQSIGAIEPRWNPGGTACRLSLWILVSLCHVRKSRIFIPALMLNH